MDVRRVQMTSLLAGVRLNDEMKGEGGGRGGGALEQVANVGRNRWCGSLMAFPG